MACQTTTNQSGLTAHSPRGPLTRNGRLAQLVLDSAPDAMVVVNQQGKIILVNRQTEQLFGYSRNELLDQPVEILMPERFRKRHVEHLARYVAEPRILAMGTGLDLYARYRDGSEFPIEIMLSPLRMGRQLLVSSVIRDVTERKRADVESQSQRLTTQRLLDLRSQELRSKSEELHVAEAMATIGTLTAGILHDLGNALQPIRCHLSALHKHESIDAIDNVKAIENAMDYIGDLCKRLRLLMARTERQDNAATDLNEWWREVTPLLTGVLPRQVKLEPAIPDDLPLVQIGRVELTQAVFNLAHNASRALRGTEPAILKIWAVPCADGHTICVRVTDNGEGMRPETRERILNSTFTNGTQDAEAGLGLRLVKSIVSRAKGSIDIDSEPGKGTTVTLVLPTEHNGSPLRASPCAKSS
ncbi:MAG: PAS domain S-box protein [Phycisphaerales bacterium]|nr:PAS domain S-box protein [Phycisphaerales bacterium]